MERLIVQKRLVIYLNDMLTKFLQKEGVHWEQVRLNMFLKKYKTSCAIRLVKSKREDWVNLREQSVKASTVNRELNLISHTLTCARRWRWISHNPMADLQRPKNPPARFRRISEKEIKEMCFVLGYRFVAVAFLFAIETAMRAGEICSLTRSNINRDTRVKVTCLLNLALAVSPWEFLTFLVLV